MTKRKSKLVLKPFSNQLFTVEHLRVLWIAGNECKQQIEQWASMRSYKDAAEYEAKLDALVRVMENVTVFNVGGGLNGFGINPDIKPTTAIVERLESFSPLFNKEK